MILKSTLRRRLLHSLSAAVAAARAWQVLLLVLVVVVSWLALTPRPPAGADFGWDKLNHALAFTALAFSACLGYPASRSARLFLLFALLAFGGLIEILQLVVPARSSDWGDLLADSIGIVCGAAIAAAALRAAGRITPESTPVTP